MKAILMSIKPKWCEKIFSGEKTVEVRKTALETPFKVYVYETKTGFIEAVRGTCPICAFSRGKVVGEFVCDTVEENIPDYNPAYERFFYNSFECGADCLTSDEIAAYGKGDPLYGWHITEPKLYDKPKELSEFRKPDFFRDCEKDCRKNCDMEYYRCPTRDSHKASTMAGYCRKKGKNLTRPPQSYCYVEEIEE